MSDILHSYLENIHSSSASIPAIMDEKTALQSINFLFQKNFFHLDEIKESALHTLFFYDIPEWKKQFDIASVRKISEDIALKPYSGKHILLLKNFDTAGVPAQNSALKLIEECPSYAVIWLVVENPKNLLATISSRAINLFATQKNIFLDEETITKLDDFNNHNPLPWIQYLYSHEYDREQSITILTKVFWSLNFEQQKKCQFFINSLSSTNEKPRNILEAFFLWEDFFS